MEHEKFMLPMLGGFSNLYYFQTVHLGPSSDLIEIISKILWYVFQGIKKYFEYFLGCGNVMMAKIMSYCFSFDNEINLINQGGEVCYRWCHMYCLQSFNHE